MTEPRFHLIATGGTLDSYYDTDRCTVLCHPESKLKQALTEYAKIPEDSFRFEELRMKDSREINDMDRADMVAAIERSSCRAIVLTHGSFTLFETARYLAERLKYNERTVILTGALKPLEGFIHSDAPWNLGAAVLAAQYAPPGVHICIEGQLHRPHSREHWH